MGAKRKDKESKDEEKARPGARQSTFRLPEPDRTIHISAPPVLPPFQESEDTDGAGYEAEAFALPRKMQLMHLSLLTRPVAISAIDNFLTEEECRGWISWGERKGFEEAKQKQNSVFAHRDNGRIEFDGPEVASQIWLRMKPFVPETVGSPPRKALGCSPRIRVYRYTRGQRFGQHVDGSREEPSMGGSTHFTVLIYLNGGDREEKDLQVKGGETVFWKDHDGKKPALVFPPTRGVCLFHGHGDDCMTHEGAGVEDGVKYILRTDVVYEDEK
ncbi:unnamed protein product [Polarella glacialis]|uniref:Prolyl 4-hydroxylase alpha subunit domain-containing protein n=1 Tax=Polarella glacialis TaxID=89957 RepID=A0A813INY2_POLGL|nr:unnamed protein product [Polarella glacialis]